MKRTLPIIAVLGALAIMAVFTGACGGNIDKSEVPKWYLNPPKDKDMVYGAGASEKTASIELGKQVAEANARNALAGKIQVSIQSMVRTYLSQSGSIDEARALQHSESIGKNVVNLTLVGVTFPKSDMRGGRYFTLAAISKDTVNNSLLKAVQDAQAQIAEAKAKQAFQDLEREIEGGKTPVIE